MIGLYENILILIIGQASSGKSKIAENICVCKAKEYGVDKVYIATMEKLSDSSKKRIEKHQKMREGKAFLTVEEMYELNKHCDVVKDKVVLLECVSNLCANVLYKQCGDEVANDEKIHEIANKLFKDIVLINNCSAKLIIVSADIFSDGVIYDEWTVSYMKLLSEVNKKLAKESSNVYEIIAGSVSTIK